MWLAVRKVGGGGDRQPDWRNLRRTGNSLVPSKPGPKQGARIQLGARGSKNAGCLRGCGPPSFSWNFISRMGIECSCGAPCKKRIAVSGQEPATQSLFFNSAPFFASAQIREGREKLLYSAYVRNGC